MTELKARTYLSAEIATNEKGNAAVVAGALGRVLSAVVDKEGIDAFSENLPVETNLPQVLDDGETPAITIDVSDDGVVTWGIHPDAVDVYTGSSVCVVPIWDENETIAAETGAPYKRLDTLYILAMPSVETMRKDAKLREAMDNLLARDVLAKARSVAKKLHDGIEGVTLMSDPIAQYLAATTSAASRESAFNALFTTLQAFILKQVSVNVERLKAAGHNAQARTLAAMFSRPMLSKPTLKACLTSQEAAERHFPTMAVTKIKDAETGLVRDAVGQERGKRWDDMLRLLINHAPNHKVKQKIKDADGNVVKDAEGKPTMRAVAKPQSPAIFAYWLENRYNVADEPEQTDADVIFDFDSVTM